MIHVVLFFRFLFEETVSDYRQFPYFCLFVVRDVASGFSMRNREKDSKYRTIPQHCARTGIGSIWSRSPNLTFEESTGVEAFFSVLIPLCVFSPLSR